MEEHRCEVREFRSSPNCSRCTDKAVWDHECPLCRIGCFAVAMFENPCYDPSGQGKGIYNYAMWLCAEHYDEVEGFLDRFEKEALEPWEQDIVDDKFEDE
jgi:hypothetical protein